jgi:hypothetical protein
MKNFLVPLFLTIAVAEFALASLPEGIGVLITFIIYLADVFEPLGIFCIFCNGRFWSGNLSASEKGREMPHGTITLIYLNVSKHQ